MKLWPFGKKEDKKTLETEGDGNLKSQFSHLFSSNGNQQPVNDLGEDAIATTMLGSPLNMAPEILGGKDYNNKADIWSIGTCIYELLFGKPPYTAKNIVELLQKIKKKPFSFEKNCHISSVLQDVLMKMLVFDPNNRISWEDLFNHSITKMMDERIMVDLEETMKNNAQK